MISDIKRRMVQEWGHRWHSSLHSGLNYQCRAFCGASNFRLHFKWPRSNPEFLQHFGPLLPKSQQIHSIICKNSLDTEGLVWAMSRLKNHCRLYMPPFRGRHTCHYSTFWSNVSFLFVRMTHTNLLEKSAPTCYSLKGLVYSNEGARKMRCLTCQGMKGWTLAECDEFMDEYRTVLPAEITCSGR
jgi:hypothetical protein